MNLATSNQQAILNSGCFDGLPRHSVVTFNIKSIFPLDIQFAMRKKGRKWIVTSAGWVRMWKFRSITSCKPE